MFQAVSQLIQISRILAGQVPHVQRMEGKAEALKFVELGLNTSVRVALDGASQPAILPLGAHKQQLIVKGCGHVALGIHFAAHGLGFQPYFFVAAALHQHGVLTELLQVQQALPLCFIEKSLQLGVITGKGYTGYRKHHRIIPPFVY